MAVVVVSVLMTAILPMVVLSTSARVQARRTELASQAARGFVDGVRSGVINLTSITDSSGVTLPFPFISSADRSTSQYFTNVLAPSNTNLASLTLIKGIKIDGNGNGFSVNDPQDFVVQPMRSDGADVTTQGFYMQLRVYRADAFQNNNLSAIKSGLTLQTETSCPSSRQAFSNSGGSLVCPVVVVKLDVYPSTSTLDQIKSRL
jgi:type II secretory pathway pseudopilin PulG